MAAGHAEKFLKRWHEVVETRDLGALPDLLSEDISLGAPPYWQRLEGKELVHHLLTVILETIEGFTYYREWHQEAESDVELALEFRGKVDGLDVQGMDLITLDEAGLVVKLDVLVRPMNVLGLLQEKVSARMQVWLAERAGQ